MVKRTAVILSAVMVLALLTGGRASASARDFLARFEGAVGVNPAGGVVGPQNADGSFQNVAQNVVRGVKPAGSPWRIASLRADVDADGSISVRGRGLLLAGGDRLGESLGLSVGATLVCETTIPFVEHSTASLTKLDANGDFRIDDVLSGVPAECAAPVLLIRANGTGPWLAAGILKLGDE